MLVSPTLVEGSSYFLKFQIGKISSFLLHQHQFLFKPTTMVKGHVEEASIAIDELKRRMGKIVSEDPYLDDKVFYRFLKARNFNIDNAERMLKQHLKERKKYDLENILKWKRPEVLEKYFSLNIIGHDKEGNPVAYIPSGSIDWIGLYQSSKFDDILKYIAYYMEMMKDLKCYNNTVSSTADKQIFIHNMENFTFAQATNKKVILNTIFLINLYLDNYPETLKNVYVINTSVHFHLLFSILQKFLPSSLIDKFQMYSDDSWKDALLEIMDAEVLPAFLGGKKTDPDGNPLCTTFIRHGKPVPENCYIHRSKRSLASIPGTQRLKLPRATFREIILEVKELDSYIEWEFETESRDVGFGLFRMDDEGNTIEIIPLQRINTDEFSETGLYKCEDVGKYIIIFDNTYSIIRKKEIFYRINVKKQNEEELEFKQSDDQDV